MTFDYKQILERFCKLHNLQMTILDDDFFDKKGERHRKDDWRCIYFPTLSQYSGNLCTIQNSKVRGPNDVVVYSFYYNIKYLFGDSLYQSLFNDMCNRRFVMYKNDHSRDFSIDIVFPHNYAELDIQLTLNGV